MSEIHWVDLFAPIPEPSPQEVRDARIQLAEAAIAAGDEGSLGRVLEMVGVR